MTHHPRRRGELVQSPGSDGWTLYERDTDSLHVLNESAHAIWELCDGETTPEEMAAAIAEVTGIGLDQAGSDVEEALGKLRELGLVDDGRQFDLPGV